MPLIRSRYFSFIIFPNLCNLPSSVKRTQFIKHKQNNCNMIFCRWHVESRCVNNSNWNECVFGSSRHSRVQMWSISLKISQYIWQHNIAQPFSAGIFFLILAHPVCKLWIIQEPKKVALWNKRHFEEKRMQHFKNIQYIYLLTKYVKCNVWKLAVRYDIYIRR
jgi:hypothetical protein